MRMIATIAMLGMFTANAARADDIDPPATHFPKGTFCLTLETDYAHSFDLSRARIEGGSIGGGYYFVDNIAFNIEAAGFAVDQAGANSIISDFGLRVRQHLINAGRLSVYFDFAAGVSYADHRTPNAGTNYNYTLQPGLGAAWQLRDKLFLTGGIRYWHLSNADLEGKARNPSINSIEGYVGILALF